MATIQHQVDSKDRWQHTYGKRLLVLGFVLLALILCYVVSSAGNHHLGSRDEETPVDRSNDWPSDDDVSSYISGQEIALPDAKDDSGDETEPVAIRKDQIEGLKLKREGGFFTSVDFVLKTDVGRFEVAALINHHPSDGMNVFDSFTVKRVARR